MDGGPVAGRGRQRKSIAAEPNAAALEVRFPPNLPPAAAISWYQDGSPAIRCGRTASTDSRYPCRCGRCSMDSTSRIMGRDPSLRLYRARSSSGTVMPAKRCRFRQGGALPNAGPRGFHCVSEARVPRPAGGLAVVEAMKMEKCCARTRDGVIRENPCPQGRRLAVAP